MGQEYNQKNVLEHMTYPTDELMNDLTILQSLVEESATGDESMAPFITVTAIKMNPPPPPGEKPTLQKVLFPIQADFNTYDEKTVILTKAAQQLIDLDLAPINMSIASEAWKVNREAEELENGVVPSEEPDREEVLLIVCCSVNPPTCLTSTCPTVRDGDENISGPFEWSKVHTSEPFLVFRFVRIYQELLMRKLFSD